MIFLNEVLHKKQSGKRMLIGIDGMSGAGKTTYVERVRGELEEQKVEAAVLHLDDLIVERAKRYGTGHEEWYEHYRLQWDVERIAENVFRSWQRGDAALEMDVYDPSNDLVQRQTMSVPSDGVLIVEGVYLQREEWRGFFDFVLYIDCPRSTRFERVTKRGGQDLMDQARIELYKRRYWAAEDHYLEKVRPLEKADVVVESTAFFV